MPALRQSASEVAQDALAKLTIFGKAVSSPISYLRILSPNFFRALSLRAVSPQTPQMARLHYLLAGLAQQRPSADFARFLQSHGERR